MQTLGLITDRDTLGGLWLPWCVVRSNPDQIIQIDREHDFGRRSEARQLRVRDVVSPRESGALERQPHRDGSTKRSIQELARLCAELGAADFGLQFNEAQVFDTADGPMLREGSHRVCGIWVSRVRFEIRLQNTGPLAGVWDVYDFAGLREG